MSAKIIALPVREGRITPQDVMQMETFKHFTEEQAIELLQVFRSFCEIAYSIWSKQEEETEHHTIELVPTQQKKAA